MSGRSRVALVSLVTLLVVGIALGLGSAGRPGPSSPPPSGAESSVTVTPSVSGSAAATQASATPPGPSSEAPSGPVVTWTRLPKTGVAPTARQGATWTVDPSTGIAYLYGGTTSPTLGRPLEDGATLGDLWAYDLAADSWEPVVGTSDEPPPRSGHVAVWVEDVGLVVIGGRASDGQPLGDVWRFDPESGAWSQLALRGTQPPPRFDACAAAPGDGTIWLTHGTNGRSLFGTTWRLDLASKRWTEIARSERPITRSRTSCWVDAGGRFVVSGGDRGGATLGDLWAISVGRADADWTKLAGGGTFSPRGGAAAAIHLDEAVVFGGLGSDRAARSDLGALGPTEGTITPVPADGPTPPARAGAVLVDDPAGERMLLYGGATADGVSADLWSADLR